MEYDNIFTQTDKICRTCLNVATDRKSLLHIMDGDARPLRDILSYFINTDINLSENYPNHVCSACCDMLFKAESFKKQCIQSENVLAKVLSEANNVKKEINLKAESNEIFKYDVNFVEVDKSQLDSKFKNRSETKTSVWVSLNSNEENVKAGFGTSPLEAKYEIRNDTKNDIWDSMNCNEENVMSDDKDNESNALSVSKKEMVDEFIRNSLEISYNFDSPTRDYSPEIEIPISFLPVVEIQKPKNHKVISNNCPKCNLNFSCLKLLEHHIKTHKNQKAIEKLKNVEKLQCSLCAREFKNKKTLSKHIRRHEMRDKVKYNCNTCKRDFQHKAHLDNHILSVHTKKDGYMCEICNKSFSTQDSLNIHKESHSVEKMHSCKICGKSFIMLSTLTDHLRTHTGEKPFLCSICGRGFSQNTNLKQHVSRHLGIKPFKCEQCERRFVSKGELQAHQRKHSGAHPFVCDDCGNGFTTSSSLVKHRRIHTGERPYACDLCPMKFNASGTLKNHRRTHTGEKPFQCSHCEKAFVQRQDLVSHIRCHTGERPFICPSCGQAFRKASALKTHVKIHGKESLQRDVTLNNLQGVNMILNGI